MSFFRRFSFLDLILMALGAASYAFMGWRYNMPLAAFIASFTLIVFFRRRERWYDGLVVFPFLALGTAALFYGAWDLDPGVLIACILARPGLLVLPLFLDRLTSRRLPPVAAGLVLPAAMASLDYGLSFSPFATTLSTAVGLFGFREFSQAASLFGIWGLTFLLWWTAAGMAALAMRRFDLRAAGAAAVLPLSAFAGVLAFGSARLAADPWGVATVRVAGVSAEHPRDYWDLVEAGSPRDAVVALRPEARTIEDRLFERSERACASGAKIVVWSEGAAILDEENEPRFIERAGAFAREHRIYLAAAVLTYRFGSSLSGNKVLMLTPEGDLAFSYTKTVSWFPTDSDGAARTVDAPFGRIGAAICFDMDDPRLGRSLARAGADIVLVPAYDTEGIRPFHTEVGLFRGLENGYSIFRQVAEGTSMAADGRGVVRAFQDYFSTDDRIMIADLPARRAATLASALGDAPAWACAALLACLAAAALAPNRSAATRRAS